MLSEPYSGKKNSFGHIWRLIFSLEEFVNVPVRNLSLEQRIRCEIVAALIHRPRLLFLDEPTIGLDPETTDRSYWTIPWNIFIFPIFRWKTWLRKYIKQKPELHGDQYEKVYRNLQSRLLYNGWFCSVWKTISEVLPCGRLCYRFLDRGRFIRRNNSVYLRKGIREYLLFFFFTVTGYTILIWTIAVAVFYRGLRKYSSGNLMEAGM